MKTDPRTIEDVLRNLVAADEIRFSRDREDYILTKAAKEAIFRWKLSQLPNHRELWNFWCEEIFDERSADLTERMLCSFSGIKPVDLSEDAREWADNLVRKYHDDFVYQVQRGYDEAHGEQMREDARNAGGIYGEAA
jgi:hypothetical protein